MGLTIQGIPLKERLEVREALLHALQKRATLNSMAAGNEFCCSPAAWKSTLSSKQKFSLYLIQPCEPCSRGAS